MCGNNYSNNPGQRQIRADQIKDLANVGLSQVFMGVESFVETQQKRYNKHLHGGRQSCTDAINLLTQSGVDIEMGLIVFDPKSTKAELAETANILLGGGDLYKALDHPFSKLKLGEGSLLAQKYDLGKEKLSYNTLNYDWEFEDAEVGEIYKKCNDWFRPLHPSYSLARSLIRSLPDDENVREQLASQMSKIRQQFVLLLQSSIEKDDNEFKSYSESAKQVVINALKLIGNIARTSGLFDTQKTHIQLEQSLKNLRTEPEKKKKPISMTDFGFSVEGWETKQQKLQENNLPHQNKLCGDLNDFVANPTSILDALKREDYYKGKFYLKIIKASGSNKKIVGDQNDVINFAIQNFEPGDQYEIMAALESQIGAIAIKKDDVYLEFGETDASYFGLDKVKHSSPDATIHLSNPSDANLLQNATTFSESDMVMFTELITQYLPTKQGIRYKSDEDNGIEHYAIPHYYEAMLYQNNNEEWQVLFSDMSKDQHYAGVNYEAHRQNDRA
ncbi:MAG: hypothetical protein FWE16_00925 [Firmicutes bacterium]|nr:hypothetical protein [Bacillota bacterium]